MYSAILIWIVGILFTYGFNVKMLEDANVSRKNKILFALSIYLWIGWPVLLGDSMRRIFDKN